MVAGDASAHEAESSESARILVERVEQPSARLAADQLARFELFPEGSGKHQSSLFLEQRVKNDDDVVGRAAQHIHFSLAYHRPASVLATPQPAVQIVQKLCVALRRRDARFFPWARMVDEAKVVNDISIYSSHYENPAAAHSSK